MSLVPDKVRKTKKSVDSGKLEAFVDQGLAPAESRTPKKPAPGPKKSATVSEPSGPTSRRGPKTSTAEPAAAEADAQPWRKSMQRAPSVAFSVRIPTPLLERMRDVVAAVDGESLTSLLVEGAAARVEEIESSYSEQVGRPLPNRRRKVEL